MAGPNWSSVLILIFSLSVLLAGMATATFTDEEYWKQREEISHARNLASYEPEPEVATDHFNRAVHE